METDIVTFTKENKMFYVFDWELGNQYEFDSLDEVKEFIYTSCEDVDDKDRVEDFQIIEGKEIRIA